MHLNEYVYKSWVYNIQKVKCFQSNFRWLQWSSAPDKYEQILSGQGTDIVPTVILAAPSLCADYALYVIAHPYISQP